MKKLAILLVVLFAGICLAVSDSPDAVAVWQFDSSYESGGKLYTPDDDSVMSGRGYDLELRNGADLSTTPGFDGTGFALELDGVNDFGMRLWGQHDNVKIQLSFKADTLPAVNKYFVEIASIVRLYLNANNQPVMTVWDDGGVATTKNVATAVVAGQWYSLEASYDSDGIFSLLLFDASGTQVGSKVGAYGTGTLAKTGAVNFVVGSYRGTTYYFDGQIDAMKVSNYIYPDWAEPFVDEFATVFALYHFDAFADPNTSGTTDELLLDDDSDNPGRDSDVKLYSGSSTIVEAGEGNGPILVNPEDEGIGYPLGSDDFGKCAFFDDPVLVEADSFRMLSALSPIDPTNVRVDCWIRPADDLIDLLPADGIDYFILDRWGQFYISLKQAASTGELSIIAFSFGDNGTNKAVSVSYSELGIAPHSWVNISYRFYMGLTELYINGSLVKTNNSLGTTSLNSTTTRDYMLIGCRYDPKNYFWGYMDEMKISQAVYEVDCGAWGYLSTDLNQDCVVDVADLKVLASRWLESFPITPSDVDGVDSGVYEDYTAYNIPMASSTPTIDGTLSAGEWADAKEIYLALPEVITAPNVGSFAQSADHDDPTHEDFSGYYYMKWDATNLYIGIEITDDALIFDAGYPDDHATIAINPLATPGAESEDVAFYNMYRDYFGDSVVVNQSGFNAAFDPDNAVVASATSATGWSFEAAFKWSDFDANYVPTIGDVHSAAIMICDNDDADGTRDHFLFDSGSGDTQVLGKPSLYRTVTLTSGIACGDNGYLIDPVTGYMMKDLDGDCNVTMTDYSVLASDWLDCTDLMVSDCIDAR